jgi:membrane-associated phospholipid phosphatase
VNTDEWYLSGTKIYMMMKSNYLMTILIFVFGTCRAQSDTTNKTSNTKTEIYNINYKWELPVTAIAAGITLYNFSRISKKSNPTEQQLEALNRDNVNTIDRWSMHPYSKSLDQLSYIPLYIAIPLPLLFLTDSKMRKDFLKLSYLYVETLAATGLLYSTAVNLTNRFRPFTYYSDAPQNLALESNAKKSFFGGHVALVATSTFFMARVYADYYPDSPLKWVFYGTAGALTTTTAFLRNYAGMHFLSDVLVGAGVGMLSGLLIPGLHLTKKGKMNQLTIIPVGLNGPGLLALYQF